MGRRAKIGGMSAAISRFVQAPDGAIAVKFAVILPVLLGATGLAANVSILQSQKSRLQAAVDAGALSAAKELGMADFQRDNVQAIVDAAVQTYLKTNHDTTYGNGTVKVTATFDTPALQINVGAEQSVDTPFGALFGAATSSVAVTSSARIVGRPHICVLALEPDELGAIWLERQAKLNANNCSVFSNSVSSLGLTVRDDAKLTASTICSAGGVFGEGAISPSALTDCPQFEDPLAGRAEPSVGSCTYTNLDVIDEHRSLAPGVYCGGLTIRGTSVVTFEEGVHIIKSGLFSVTDGAWIQGRNAGFFMTGISAFIFGPNSHIRLTAPRDGPLAGLLFFGSRSQSKLLTHLILSNDARQLLGTIYLPQNSLIVDASAPVGQESAYTAIVARRLVLQSGPTLTLNSNYDQADIPVPDGIRGVDQPVALVQ